MTVNALFLTMKHSDVTHKLARAILINLTKLTVSKHKTNIVVVITEKSPAMLREFVYKNLDDSLKPRRNIESIRNEFSIPLFILGEQYYPQNSIEWFGTILRNYLRLLYIKSYQHTLIIDLNHFDTAIFTTWINTLKPKLTITESVEERIKIAESVSQKTIILSKEDMESISSGKNDLLVKEINDVFGITNNTTAESFDNSRPRIKYIQLPDNSSIIDARYFYNPLPLQSLLEMFESQPESIILISDGDCKTNIPIKPNTNYIFYGNYKKLDKKINELKETYLTSYA